MFIYLLFLKTTPNICIYSAILASAAMPLSSKPIHLRWKNPDTGIEEPYELLGTSGFRDGSLSADIPLEGVSKLFNVKFSIVSQCNPHAVPFFYRSRGTPGHPVLSYGDKRWRGGMLTAWLEESLRCTMLKWVKLSHDFEIAPPFFGQDMSGVFLQPLLNGDVTVIPRVRISNYTNSLSDGTPERFKFYILEGERSIWPALLMITNHMKIEKELKKLYKKYNII